MNLDWLRKKIIQGRLSIDALHTVYAQDLNSALHKDNAAASSSTFFFGVCFTCTKGCAERCAAASCANASCSGGICTASSTKANQARSVPTEGA